MTIQDLLTRLIKSSGAEATPYRTELEQRARTGGPATIREFQVGNITSDSFVEIIARENPNIDVRGLLDLVALGRNAGSGMAASARLERMARTTEDPSTLRELACRFDFHEAVLSNPRVDGQAIHNVVHYAVGLSPASELAIVRHPDASDDDLRWVATRGRSGTARIAAADALAGRSAGVPRGAVRDNDPRIQAARDAVQDPSRPASELVRFLDDTLPDDVFAGIMAELERRVARATAPEEISFIVAHTSRFPGDAIERAAITNPATSTRELQSIRASARSSDVRTQADGALARRGA